MEELISVIVPVYKVEAHLDQCVASIAAQTYRNLEILLVDDGSPDRCPQMCEEWARRDGRVRVLHKKNGGLSDARNAGLDAAKGDYIAFVDSDDTIHPGMLACLHDAMLCTGADLALCDFEKADAPVTAWPALPPQIPQSVHTRDEIFRSILVEYVVAWNKLYKRTLFDGLRYTKGRFHEDELLAHHLLWNIRQAVWVHYPFYSYLQHVGSIMSLGTEARQQDSLSAFEDRVDFCLRQGRTDLAVCSLDTLLAYCENNQCRHYTEFSAQGWERFRQRIRQDREKWGAIANRGQKMRFHLLLQNPKYYFQKKEALSRIGLRLHNIRAALAGRKTKP